MKKLLVVLLSLGFVMAFSMSAFAVAIDATGQYYARGSYIDNPSLLDKDNGGKSSYSYADQRLRMFFRLKIVEGVTFTTRMDALETVWGLDTGLRPGTAYYAASATSAKTNRDFAEQQLSFEQAWVNFKTGIGSFDVGYRSGTPYSWGTEFQNATGTAPGIRYLNTFGAVSVIADWFANDRSGKGDDTFGVPNLKQTDKVSDYYDLGATYKFKDGETGILLTYFRDSTSKTTAGGYQRAVYNFQPYVKTKIGPVNVEAEAYWMMGKDRKYDDPVPAAGDIDVNAKGLYVNGKFNMGPAYVGAIFMYNSGDDASTADKKEGSMNNTLKYGGNTGPFAGDGPYPVILFGDDYHDFLSTQGDGTVTDPSTRGDNLFLYQIYGGYQFNKKLDLNVKLSMLQADKDPKATGWQSKNYGTELDARLKYKVYDCLSYNVGLAYLWTGDYFKGTNTNAKLSNNYMLTHWIDLNF